MYDMKMIWTLWVLKIPVPIDGERCNWIHERSYILNCREIFEFMIDHHSYTHNLSSCEINSGFEPMPSAIPKERKSLGTCFSRLCYWQLYRLHSCFFIRFTFVSFKISWVTGFFSFPLVTCSGLCYLKYGDTYTEHHQSISPRHYIKERRNVYTANHQLRNVAWCLVNGQNNYWQPLVKKQFFSSKTETWGFSTSIHCVKFDANINRTHLHF